MIEDSLPKCAFRDLARPMLGDLIKQKDVMMGLAKGQRVVNMRERGLHFPLFSSAPSALYAMYM